MTGGDRQAVARWMDWADDALAQADLLHGHGHWAGATNRAYYACFYAVSALLLTRDLSAARHAGVLELFEREFVKSGAVPRETARVYRDLFRRRMEVDYRARDDTSADQAGQDVASARQVVQAVRRLVEQALP